LVKQMSRSFFVAFLLAVEGRDREVDLKICPIRMCVRELGKHFARAPEVELAHQADGPVLGGDLCPRQPAVAALTRAGTHGELQECTNAEMQKCKRERTRPRPHSCILAYVHCCICAFVHFAYHCLALVSDEVATRMMPLPCSMAIRVPKGCDS